MHQSIPLPVMKVVLMPDFTKSASPVIGCNITTTSVSYYRDGAMKGDTNGRMPKALEASDSSDDRPATRK